MISALITVYHPSGSVVHNVRSIAKQADIVYICDNSPTSNHDMFAFIDDASDIRYIFFGENLGISRAYNRILTDPEIRWHDNDYIFFFDQDSLIAEHHIEQMISVYKNVQQKGLPIGCLGPAYFNTSSGHVETPKSKKILLKDTYSVSSIITSSMLCSYSSLRSVGFWNDDIFLDLADWDLCWRMTAAGKLCCITEASVLHHSLGIGEKKLGPLRLRVGNPYREYYQIRESSYLLGKKYTPLKYRIRFIAMLLIRSPLHLIFLEHRKERLKYITMGLVDFFRKKKGPLNS